MITVVQSDPKSIYRRIPELNGLMDKVREGHGRLLDGKRAELLEIIRQCMKKSTPCQMVMFPAWSW